MENKARPRSGWTRFILVYAQPDARFPPKGFPKNILHLSGCILILSLLVCYGLKDVSGIFQPSFIPQGRERKISRLRMKNRLAEIDFSFGAERNDILLSPEENFTSICITAN